MNDRTVPSSGKKWLDRLPGPERDALIGIGRRGRGLFGRARFQRIFDDNLTMFEHLAAQGATAAIIGQLLAAVGLVRDDGTAVPVGKSNPVIFVMQSTEDWAAKNTPCPLYGAR
jgi:hypothetical protein